MVSRSLVEANVSASRLFRGQSFLFIGYLHFSRFLRDCIDWSEERQIQWINCTLYMDWELVLNRNWGVLSWALVTLHNQRTSVCFVLLRWAIVSSENPRCALTSAGGVNASHWLSEISWNSANWKTIELALNTTLINEAYRSWELQWISRWYCQCFQCSALRYVAFRHALIIIGTEKRTIRRWYIRNIARLHILLWGCPKNLRKDSRKNRTLPR